MRKLVLAALGGFALLLAGCGTLGIPAPQTPAQAVYEAKASFLGALKVANEYKALPSCPAAVLCSDAATVATIRTAANTASVALDAAQATVTDPNFKDGSDAEKTITAAEEAVSAFVTIAGKLKVSP